MAKLLTQQELADQTGVSLATIHKIENGQVMPSALTRERLRRLDGWEDLPEEATA